MTKRKGYITFLEMLIGVSIVLVICLGFATCTEYLTASYIEDVDAKVVNLWYKPAHTETYYRQQAVGNITIQVPEQQYYNEEWHVTYNKVYKNKFNLNYDLQVCPNYCGIAIGDFKRFKVYKGGVSGNYYLSLN